jgi:hypothetical protein
MTTVKKLQQEIKLYNKVYEPWLSRSDKIVDRYLDERKITPNGNQADVEARFNILWANTETIFPAVYSKVPKPDVSRRYKDKDPVGRVASLLLERCLEYEIEQYPDYDSAIRQALQDRLLPGRGVAWIRYEPNFVNVPVEYESEEASEDVEVEGAESVTGQITEDTTEYQEVLANECAPVDYVGWKDFGHDCAKTWEEVKHVWRKVMMDKEDMERRFGIQAEERGYKISDIPATEKPVDSKDNVTIDAENTKACIYEVWCKEDKKVRWIADGFEYLLDERDDPLELQGFFPCPKPLYATISTAKLIPTPDFAQYQDQARELDEVTDRIGRLVKAVKVVGVYDASQTAIKRMLQEGVTNELIPVDTWAVYADKGGMKGVMEFLPLDMVVNALATLYEAREQIKAVIYEITGIADILRGSSNPNETLGAQEIKANYAGLRIRRLQMDVARFARDLIRFKAEIITKFFSDETIVAMSGAEHLSDEDRQYIGQALALLRDDVTRGFRIDIETDSMVEADEAAEKQEANELLAGTADYMEKAVMASKEAPQIAPLMLEVLMFVLRRHKVGKSIEGQFQETFDNIIAELKNPQQKPDPEMAKVQAEQQAEQMRMQAQQQQEQARMQADMMIERAKGEMNFQLEQQRMAMQAQIEEMKSQREAERAQQQAMIDVALEEFKARLQAETQITTAQISADATLSAEQESAADKAVD